MLCAFASSNEYGIMSMGTVVGQGSVGACDGSFLQHRHYVTITPVWREMRRRGPHSPWSQAHGTARDAAFI